MDFVVLLTEKEQALVKKSKSLTNEVLAEKISVEKLRIEGRLSSPKEIKLNGSTENNANLFLP